MMGKLVSLLVGLSFAGFAFAQTSTTPGGTSYVPGGGGSGNATTINGASIPTSQACVGTNSSAQIVSASCGGSSAFSGLTSGTNTAAAMLVGTGASLGATGSGTIGATSAPVAGITGLGSGIATFLATPTSANLAAAMTNETGSGLLVFGTAPTITLPNGTGLPLTTGVTGILPVANGGTGTANPSLVAGSNITITGSWPNQTIAGSAGGGGVTSFASSNGFAGTITSNVATLSTSITGPLKGNGTALQAAAASDIVGLFSGTCNSTTVLTGNGTCSAGTPIPSLPSYTTPVGADLMIVYSQANAAADQSTISVLQAEFLALGLRIQTAATATSITPTVGTADQINQANTQATGTLTINNPTGTPTDGQRLTIRLTSTNVQTYSWGTAYHAGATALPTASTGGGKHDYIGFIYDGVSSQWDFVSTALGY